MRSIKRAATFAAATVGLLFAGAGAASAQAFLLGALGRSALVGGLEGLAVRGAVGAGARLAAAEGRVLTGGIGRGTPIIIRNPQIYNVRRTVRLSIPIQPPMGMMPKYRPVNSNYAYAGGGGRCATRVEIFSVPGGYVRRVYRYCQSS